MLNVRSVAILVKGAADDDEMDYVLFAMLMRRSAAG